MPTRTFTPAYTLVEATKQTSGVLAASDDTVYLDVSKFKKANIWVVCGAFGTGNITVTAQTSPDQTNVATFGTALTVSATGTTLYGGASNVDISSAEFLKFTRGADSNTGTIQIIVKATV